MLIPGLPLDAAIVLMQVANVHVCRSRRRSIFSGSLLENRLITFGIVTELAVILLIDYTPVGNALFGTAPIDHSVWLFSLPFIAIMVMLEEGRKAIVRTGWLTDVNAGAAESVQYRRSARVRLIRT